jgi:hypothetical protein
MFSMNQFWFIVAISKNKNKNRPSTIGSFMKTIGSLRFLK